MVTPLASADSVFIYLLQFGFLNIQLKDLQKQVTTVQAEKAAASRERDENRAEVAKLQTKLQASAMQVGVTLRNLPAEGRKSQSP